MRRLYLIRHGHPDFPIGSRICLGQTDTPLGPLGRLQSVLLARTFSVATLSGVYTSPLSRAYATARCISQTPLINTGLSEQSTGLWDGLSFDEIARRWPSEYAERGKNPTLTMPEGEPLAHALARFTDAVNTILESSEGDIAIVSHKGVINTFVQQISQQITLPKLPYGAFWQLTLEGNALTLKNPAPIKPLPELDRTLCLALLQAVAPEQVIAHCEAVEAFALELAAQLPLALDAALIGQAALLHDIARVQSNHAYVGAQWLDLLGYPQTADIVRQHHDLATSEINEASIVYMADKCLQGTQRVSIHTRFAAAKMKCQSKEALSAWKKRWQITNELQKNINIYCGKEIIP